MGKPWESVPHIWKGEQAYLNWLRGAVRRVWSRHPVKVEYCRKAETLTPRQLFDRGLEAGCKLSKQVKKVRECEMCHKWWPVSRMEVDHVHGGVGFHDYETFLQWQHRMWFVGFDDIRLLCVACHADVTACQQYKCDMHNLPVHREFTRFRDMKAAGQRDLLELQGITPGSNNKLREEQYWAILQEKLE